MRTQTSDIVFAAFVSLALFVACAKHSDPAAPAATVNPADTTIGMSEADQKFVVPVSEVKTKTKNKSLDVKLLQMQLTTTGQNTVMHVKLVVNDHPQELIFDIDANQLMKTVDLPGKDTGFSIHATSKCADYNCEPFIGELLFQDTERIDTATGAESLASIGMVHGINRPKDTLVLNEAGDNMMSTETLLEKLEIRYNHIKHIDLLSH